MSYPWVVDGSAMVNHYSPWNEQGIARKLQIAGKLPPADVERGWGLQHTRRRDQLELERVRLLEHARDLYELPVAGRALDRLGR